MLRLARRERSCLDFISRSRFAVICLARICRNTPAHVGVVVPMREPRNQGKNAERVGGERSHAERGNKVNHAGYTLTRPAADLSRKERVSIAQHLLQYAIHLLRQRKALRRVTGSSFGEKALRKW